MYILISSQKKQGEDDGNINVESLLFLLIIIIIGLQAPVIYSEHLSCVKMVAFPD
jgi:hypothetical protein